MHRCTVHHCQWQSRRCHWQYYCVGTGTGTATEWHANFKLNFLKARRGRIFEQLFYTGCHWTGTGDWQSANFKLNCHFWHWQCSSAESRVTVSTW